MYVECRKLNRIKSDYCIFKDNLNDIGAENDSRL